MNTHSHTDAQQTEQTNESGLPLIYVK